MKFRTAALTLALGLAFTAGANAVTIGFNPRTGDVWVDTQLRDVNQYGYDNRDYFIDDLVGNYGAPRYLVNELLTTRRWAPGDVYYACVLAYRLHRPCGDVVHMYDENHGQGWGVIAQRMGIKPGSAAFHALKGDVDRSNGRFKTHGHGPGSNTGGRDNGGRDNGSSDNGPGMSGVHADKHGNSGEHGPGNSEHGNSGGQGKGKSKKGGGH